MGFRETERPRFDRAYPAVRACRMLKTCLRALTFFSFALLAASAACTSNSGGPSGSALTCQNGTGPESEACDACGQTHCAAEASAVTSACATMVTCIRDCQCDASGTCLDGCVTAASTSCQSLINAYGSCEKSAAACATPCSE